MALFCVNALFAQLNPTGNSNTSWYVIKTTERTAPISKPTQTERYGVDYELVDYVFVNADSSILEDLNLDYLESFRQSDKSVVVLDKPLGVKVKLYAVRFDVSNTNSESQE